MASTFTINALREKSKTINALQEKAKKSGYMIFTTANRKYIVTDLLTEICISIEDNLVEVADLLSFLCVKTLEERISQINAYEELPF